MNLFSSSWRCRYSKFETKKKQKTIIIKCAVLLFLWFKCTAPFYVIRVIWFLIEFLFFFYWFVYLLFFPLLIFTWNWKMNYFSVVFHYFRSVWMSLITSQRPSVFPYAPSNVNRLDGLIDGELIVNRGSLFVCLFFPPVLVTCPAFLRVKVIIILCVCFALPFLLPSVLLVSSVCLLCNRLFFTFCL